MNGRAHRPAALVKIGGAKGSLVRTSENASEVVFYAMSSVSPQDMRLGALCTLATAFAPASPCTQIMPPDNPADMGCKPFNIPSFPNNIPVQRRRCPRCHTNLRPAHTPHGRIWPECTSPGGNPPQSQPQCSTPDSYLVSNGGKSHASAGTRPIHGWRWAYRPGKNLAGTAPRRSAPSFDSGLLKWPARCSRQRFSAWGWGYIRRSSLKLSALAQPTAGAAGFSFTPGACRLFFLAGRWLFHMAGTFLSKKDGNREMPSVPHTAAALAASPVPPGSSIIA